MINPINPYHEMEHHFEEKVQKLIGKEPFQPPILRQLPGQKFKDYMDNEYFKDGNIKPFYD